MFDVAFDAEDSLVATRCAGFWDDAEACAYRSAFVDAARRSSGPFDAIVDMSRFPPQSSSGSSIIGDMIKELTELGLRRVAIVTSSAILRMQANRIGASNTFSSPRSVEHEIG